MFEVKNLAFTYRSRPVLRDVSFVVSPGETVCVVGANGAGKTTLLRILATLAVPDYGSVRMDGQDAFAHPIAYRRQLGYMQETPALYEDMTVRGYLEYRANLKGEPERRIRRRVGEAAEMCQVADLMKKPIRTLSAGLKKRVALADAVLLRPRLLLLDDFLAGLDAGLRSASGAILSSVAAFSSVIVTGHELPDLAKWATRFLVLRDGVVASTVQAAGADAAALVARVEKEISGGAK
ncbi:MAG: ABC transporter ATP-binding protein [Kiritimatiellae bacterium]|nr:ABC transporter ATP-binding protein [Kiritimatiellia bacterium]